MLSTAKKAPECRAGVGGGGGAEGALGALTVCAKSKSALSLVAGLCCSGVYWAVPLPDVLQSVGCLPGAVSHAVNVACNW
jgi:hypothetical protein